MRIILANHTPISGSGSGTYTLMLASALEKLGHKVIILCPHTHLLHEKYKQVILSPVDKDWKKIIGNFVSFTGHPLSGLTYRQLDTYRLNFLLKKWEECFIKLKSKWKPDIIHVQHLWVLAKAAINAGIKPVVTCHGSELHFIRENKILSRSLIPDLNKVRLSIYISQYVFEQAHEILNKASMEITLHNPYNDALFYFLKNSSDESIGFPEIKNKIFKIGFVGRLVKYKNCDLFLECIYKVRKKIPNLEVIIIGDGPEKRRLQNIAQKLDLMQVIHFKGNIEQRELCHFYRIMDLLVVPSENEPFGLVAIEAAACGAPVIAAKSGGLRELIQPPFIIGFKSNNVFDLYSKIIITLNKYHNHSKTFFDKEKVSNYIFTKYSLEKYILTVEKYYKMILKTGD